MRGGFAWIKAPLARLYFRLCCFITIAFLCFGLLLAFVIPPLAVPDEAFHVSSSIRRIEQVLHGNKGEICSRALGLIPQFAADIHFHPERPYPRDRFRTLERMPEVCLNEVDALGSVWSYLPSLVASIFLPNLHKSPDAAFKYFYLSRICSGLLILVLLVRIIYVATQSGSRIPAGLVTSLAFCLSPIFLQQSFGLNTDPIINASILALSVVVIGGRQVRVWDWLVFVTLGLAAGVAKPVILPIFATMPVAGLLLDFSRHPLSMTGGRFSVRDIWRSHKRVIVSVLLSVFVCVSVVLVILDLPKALESNHGPLANPAQQVAYIKENPLAAWKVVWDQTLSIFNLRGYVEPLGWLDAYLGGSARRSWIKILAATLIVDIFVLAIGIRNSIGQWRQRTTASYCNLALSYTSVVVGVWTCAMAACLAMYIAFTKPGADIVSGVQMRYFFPSVMTFLLFHAALTRESFGQDLNEGLEKAMRVTLFLATFLVLLFLPIFAISIFSGIAARYW